MKIKVFYGTQDSKRQASRQQGHTDPSWTEANVYRTAGVYSATEHVLYSIIWVSMHDYTWSMFREASVEYCGLSRWRNTQERKVARLGQGEKTDWGLCLCSVLAYSYTALRTKLVMIAAVVLA